MAIIDPAMGFKPITKPKFYTILKVAAAASNKIYRYMPVLVSGGYAVPAAITGQVAGIAMHHVDAAPGAITDLIVCTDPDVIYQCTGDVVGDITDVGKFVSMKTGNTGSGDLCTTTIDMTNAAATATANTPFQVVSWDSRVVTDAAASANKLCYVKLVNGQLERGFPVS